MHPTLEISKAGINDYRQLKQPSQGSSNGRSHKDITATVNQALSNARSNGLTSLALVSSFCGLTLLSLAVGVTELVLTFTDSKYCSPLLGFTGFVACGCFCGATHLIAKNIPDDDNDDGIAQV